MRVIEAYVTLSCIPSTSVVVKDGVPLINRVVYCDKVDNCDHCLRDIMATVERESEDAQNFKVEKIVIAKILDLKERNER